MYDDYEDEYDNDPKKEKEIHPFGKNRTKRAIRKDIPAFKRIYPRPPKRPAAGNIQTILLVYASTLMTSLPS